MKRLLRLTGAAACLAAVAYFLLPLRFGVFHIGMLYPSALLCLCAAALLFPAAVKKLFTGRLRKWAIAGAALLGAGVACICVTLCIIGFAAADAPAEEEDVTVLVLGCQVIGDQPSVMLRARIQSAYEYLSAHPDAKCVATGGKGSNEHISEGECIRRVLVEMGIDAERIYVEDRSVNTAENMAFSAAIIRENGLSTTVAVASDNFHQLRASLFARRNGLETRSLGCESAWYLSGGYWAREVLALYAAFLRGY